MQLVFYIDAAKYSGFWLVWGEKAGSTCNKRFKAGIELRTLWCSVRLNQFSTRTSKMSSWLRGSGKFSLFSGILEANV